MLIESKEVDRFASLVSDIRSGLLPQEIAGSALLAFFVENPHLLMIEKFDEHMQVPVSEWQAEILSIIAEDLSLGEFDLPHLEFRTPPGRWAGLIDVPPLFKKPSEKKNPSEKKKPSEKADPAFLFSFGARRVLKKASGWQNLEYDQFIDELDDLMGSDVVTLSSEVLLADLKDRIREPRESSSVLWSPKLWTPREQVRQRVLLDATLKPHFERWRAKGICLDDLNPSEFEDLVGEVLFAAGLKIYKVRQVPQGGRDLIARGILVPNEEPIEMAVEVKHRRVVDRPEVQLALYQNRAYPALLFVTSGRFTAGVFQEKRREENRFRLFLKDGFAVGDLVRTHFALEAEIRPTGLNARDLPGRAYRN